MSRTTTPNSSGNTPPSNSTFAFRLLPFDFRAEADAWLNPKEDAKKLKPLLKPPPEDLLVIRPVSPLVNSVKNDYPELLQEYAALE